jgi:hypothetical protein
VPHALFLGVRLDQCQLLLAATGHPQIVHGDLVNRENRRGGTEFGANVAQRRAVGQRHLGHTLAVEPYELAHHAVLAQHLGDGEHHVGGGDASDLKLPQWVTVAIGGVIGLILALVFGGDQFQANFLLFLHVVSYYITPWVAVLLVEHFLVQRAGRNSLPVENFYTPTGAFGRLNIAGLASMVVGVLISVPFMANDFYTGPIGSSLDGADLSYFVSGIVAALIYPVARRGFAPRRDYLSSVGRPADCNETSRSQKLGL